MCQLDCLKGAYVRELASLYFFPPGMNHKPRDSPCGAPGAFMLALRQRYPAATDATAHSMSNAPMYTVASTTE